MAKKKKNKLWNITKWGAVAWVLWKISDLNVDVDLGAATEKEEGASFIVREKNLQAGQLKQGGNPGNATISSEYEENKTIPSILSSITMSQEKIESLLGTLGFTASEEEAQEINTIKDENETGKLSRLYDVIVNKNELATKDTFMEQFQIMMTFNVIPIGWMYIQKKGDYIEMGGIPYLVNFDENSNFGDEGQVSKLENDLSQIFKQQTFGFIWGKSNDPKDSVWNTWLQNKFDENSVQFELDSEFSQ